MDIQPIHGIPALQMDEYLVVGDLHIGVESHLRSKGFHLVSHTDNMFDSISEAAGDNIDKLIVLGDVKDSVPGSTKQEYREIPAFFEKLLDRFSTVDVVRGNHDTGLEEFLPGRVQLRPASGLVIEDVGLVHGHTWPSEKVMSADTLVLAHDHPAVMFRDGVGRQISEPCWVRGNFKEISSDKYDVLPKKFIIIPAFNRMLGGSPVNIANEPLLGPILNSGYMDLDGASIHLLDGICLGRREDLMIAGRERFGRGRIVKNNR